MLAEDGPPPPAVSAETLIEAARTALSRGKLDDAEFLLGGVKPGEGDADDLDFLRGTIALGQGDWQTAIARFRAMLARDPTLLRVRLDLAFAYFQAREDKQAAYHFRLVLGEDDLPPAVRANTLAFLDRIRRRKSWSVSGALALAPDSNINAATSSREVNLFGFPAQLSEDARQTSGVGPERHYLGGIRSTHLTGSEVPHRRPPVSGRWGLGATGRKLSLHFWARRPSLSFLKLSCTLVEAGRNVRWQGAAETVATVVLGTILRSGRRRTDRQKAASFASMDAMMMSSSLPLALMTVCSRWSSR